MNNRLVHSIIFVYFAFLQLACFKHLTTAPASAFNLYFQFNVFLSLSKFSSKMFTGCCFIKLYSNFFEAFLLSVQVNNIYLFLCTKILVYMLLSTITFAIMTRLANVLFNILYNFFFFSTFSSIAVMFLSAYK